MEDIRSVLNQFRSKQKKAENEVQKAEVNHSPQGLTSEIPDVFFDEILQKIKLSRSEILVLMYLYRQVWCRPNLFKAHGIGPLNSYATLAEVLHLSQEELIQQLRNLEERGLIETVRSGQYFIRRFFTEELDKSFQQNYDEFF